MLRVKRECVSTSGEDGWLDRLKQDNSEERRVDGLVVLT